MGDNRLFTFTVAVFSRSEFDLESDDFAADFLIPPFRFVARVTVRALSSRRAAAAAYYQTLGRQRAGILRQLRAPEHPLRHEDDLPRIHREIVSSDAYSAEHGLTFDYALDRTHVETFFFAIRSFPARSPRSAHGRDRIAVGRACELTRQLIRESDLTRLN